MTAEQVRSAMVEVEEGIARRAQEIERLREFIGETLPPGTPAVLMGDFNTTADSGELDPLFGDGWVDSFAAASAGGGGSTWEPSRNPNCRLDRPADEPYDALKALHSGCPGRIDLILVRGIPAASIVASRVVLAPDGGASPSDHYGVLTLLDW
jgi:endonuclease/exonuclease/phosphatase family metal-dependent hydrolase